MMMFVKIRCVVKQKQATLLRLKTPVTLLFFLHVEIYPIGKHYYCISARVWYFTMEMDDLSPL